MLPKIRQVNKEASMNNIPFSEGSIYFCIENKQIYYDPIGGQGRITVSGGGQNSNSKISLSSDMDMDTKLLYTEKEFFMSYTWSSLSTDDQTPTGNGTEEWVVNGLTVSRRTVSQGNGTFNIRSYLENGDNTIILRITDVYNNFKLLTFNVYLIQFDLEWNMPEIGIHNQEDIILRLTPSGNGNKTVKVSVDGTVISEEVVSTTGFTHTVTVTPQNHGSHIIEAWIEAAVDDDTISTIPLRHTGVWINGTSQVVAVLTPEISISQHSTAAIRYFVVDPALDSVSVTLKEGTEVVRELQNVDRTIQTWYYKVSNSGETNLSITCGNAIGTVTITAESFDYDINPITSGLVLDLDPAGHSNSDTNRDTFGYKDGDGVNHPLMLSSNFDWISGGFKTDDDGVTAFVIPRGYRATLDRGLFDTECRANGKSFKIIFRCENVRNYDAQLMTCKSGSVGIIVNAQNTDISSQLENMSVPYYEKRKIEMEVVIQAENEGSMAWIELKGVQSCPPIKYGNTDSWAQGTPAKLVIGSDDADVWIYRIKLHDICLNRQERQANFVADAATSLEMINRYDRNNIFNTDNSLSITKTAEANPDLRVIHLRANKMTTGKEDEVAADFEMIYKNGGEKHHLTANNVIFKAQGTSSLEYILAALNLDIDFSNATNWKNGLGESIANYAMTDNSVPVNYFNLKANVASSESANNVCLADEYNTWNPYVCAPKLENSKVRDTVEGHPCAVFFTNTASTSIEVGCRTVKAGETILYFVGDMNNSKKNFEVFGQNNSKWPKQCCVEVMNNTERPCRFKQNISDDEKWKDGNFEFRFPKNPTDEMKEAFKAMQRWVVSTDRDAATDEAFGSSIVYNGVAYTADTAEYRAAKFKAEFENYFVANAMDFHYLFTDENCMTDNRAKNLFMCYEYVSDLDDYRWSVRCDYDNDTGLGNDNSGGLTFGYGLEDTDKVGDTDVFNAADSVLWCNIRDLRKEELTLLHIKLAGSGAWDPDRRSKKFNEYQDAVCPALRAEDMYNKYFLPWINKDGAAYAKKCYGTKEYQRDQFFYYQEVYKGSQYIDVSKRSDAISMRVTVNTSEAGDLTITTYSDMYIVVMYGNGGTAKLRVKRNTPTLIECPTDSLSDTETYIFYASNLTHISSVAAMKPKFVLATTANRLQQLIIGSGDIGYKNLNMNQIGVGNNTMLEILDIRNCPRLATALDLSALTSLEEFYANGSGLTGVTLAKGIPLRICRIPAVSAFVANELRDLETFAMDSTNLLSVNIEGCPAINTYDVCAAATNLERGRLTNVDWDIDDPSVVVRLSTLKGFDAQGKAIDNFVLTGKCHVKSITQIELNVINLAFPLLELTYDSVVPSYTVKFIDGNGDLLNEQHIRQGGNAVDPVSSGLISTPVKDSDIEYHYTYIGWDKNLNNITEDRLITAVFSSSDRYYRVTYWSDEFETDVLQEDVIIAHGSSVYDGNDPEGVGIWAGWDTQATDVTSNLNIHALFIVPILPSSAVNDYDYIYSMDPNDKSAYTLEEFAGIVINGKSREYFNIGDRIKIIVPKNDSFSDLEFILELRSYKHFESAERDGEFAGPYFGMIGVMNTSQRMNTVQTNVGGYPAMSLAMFLENAVYPQLPLFLKSMIELMQVLSSAGNGSAEIVTLDAHLTLESTAEATVDNAASVPYCNEVAEGADEITFACYTNTASRIKKRYNGGGEASAYWLRSPHADGSNNARMVQASGFVGTQNNGVMYALGVSWGFCLRERLK